MRFLKARGLFLLKVKYFLFIIFLFVSRCMQKVYGVIKVK